MEIGKKFFKDNNQNIVSNISNIIPNYNSQNINNQKIDPNDKIQNNLPNYNIQIKIIIIMMKNLLI